MKSRFIVLFVILLNLVSLHSVGDKLPLWVQFENATELFRAGEFQEALDFFIEVTKSDKPFPEAEYMIGLLYLEEGELEIAQEQILKAISYNSYLQAPVDLLQYKYKLAEVYLLKEEYVNYVLTLKEIIGGDQLTLDDIRDQKAYYDILITSGLDRLLHLYRKDADNVINARILLGYYYHNRGEYKKSVNYLLTPTLALITEVLKDNYLADREYLFENSELFFKELKDNKRTLTYFKENDFFKLYYYLGESLLGLGEKERALEIWTLLAESGIESMWVNKSKKQILNPTLENWKLMY